MGEKICGYLRTGDWLDSKVPFMLGVFLFAVLLGTEETPAALYRELAAYGLYVSMFLAFSYVINDFTDLEVDQAAGKRKVMFSLSRPVILTTMAGMVLLGCVPMLLLAENRGAFLAFTGLLYLAGAAYSVPGLLRFKERGFVGLLECSIAQRCLPLAAILFLRPMQGGWFATIMALSFINGLRYILIHQAIDCENDRKTGVKTFVSEGYAHCRTAIRAALVLEILLFCVLLARVCLIWPAVLLFAAGYCVFERIIAVVAVRYMGADWLCSFLAVPLEDLYNVFFPALAALLLTLADWRSIGILAFVLVLISGCFRGKLAFVRVYLTSRRVRP